MEGQQQLTDFWRADLYERDGWQVVELLPVDQGNPDSYQLAEAVWDVIADWQSPCVIIDMHQVTFLGSSMMGALVRVHKRVAMADGELRLCRLLPHPNEALHACRLHLIFAIYADVESATHYAES